MNHIMMDLETWGRKPGCAIRSIGAIMFDPLRGTGRQFYLNVDDISSSDLHLEIEPETIKWWEQFPEAAQAFKSPPPMHLARVVEAFHAFFEGNDAKYIWAHSPSFDVMIWEEICRRLGWKTPWKFRHTRDTRTLFHVKNFDFDHFPRAGTKHNAADDAKHQALAVITAWGRP